MAASKIENMVDLMKRHPESLFSLVLPTVTPNLTDEFWYLLAPSHTLFEALYINEMIKLYPVFLLPINMSE